MKETKMVQLYETKDSNNMLVKQKDIVFHKYNRIHEKEENTIYINEVIQYQEIQGFGASFTDASAYLIHEVLREEEKNLVMKKLFDKEDGIGISVVRQPMGASDYALSIYSYQDTINSEDDFEFKQFTVEHDKKYIIPILKQMLHINEEVKVMATPWSPPAWMKTSKNMIGGELRPDCYSALAEYFVRFIKAYEAQFIPIYAITVQNEPLYVPAHYPGMSFSAKEQAEFIKSYLGPAFRKENIKTKILCYDHNWDHIEYPLEVLKEAGEYVDGTAWHVYAAEPEAQTKVYNLFKEKEVYYTEASGGEWIAPFENAFTSMMRTNIGTLRNYSKTVILWNIALDENNGPTVPGFGKSTCRGLLKINQSTKEVTYNLDYYALAHFSKFIKKGARRIESSTIDGVENVSFKNVDESMVTVVCNVTKESKSMKLVYKEKECSYVLKPCSAITVIWE